ncbi:hypothetical protein ACA910_005977 [Epithemia clementina (nom. ined.)]
MLEVVVDLGASSPPVAPQLPRIMATDDGGTTAASRWKKLAAARSRLRSLLTSVNNNLHHNSSETNTPTITTTVKVFAETEVNSTEIGLFRLDCNPTTNKNNSSSSDEANIDNHMNHNNHTTFTKSATHRRGSDLARSLLFRSKNRPFGSSEARKSSYQSDLSSLTDSTATACSDSSWSTMEKSNSCSTLSTNHDEYDDDDSNSSVEISRRRPRKCILKIHTQEASLQASYCPRKQQQQQQAKAAELEQQQIQPASTIRYSLLLDSLVSGCFFENKKTLANPTPTFLTKNEHKGRGEAAKSVSFSQVRLHYHAQILGDQTGVKEGPPLSLGQWVASSGMSVDHFEKSRRPPTAAVLVATPNATTPKSKRSKDLIIPPNERRAILQRAGVSKREIARCEKAIQQARKQQQMMLANNNTNTNSSTHKRLEG